MEQDAALVRKHSRYGVHKPAGVGIPVLIVTAQGPMNDGFVCRKEIFHGRTRVEQRGERSAVRKIWYGRMSKRKTTGQLLLLRCCCVLAIDRC